MLAQSGYTREDIEQLLADYEQEERRVSGAAEVPSAAPSSASAVVQGGELPVLDGEESSNQGSGVKGDDEDAAASYWAAEERRYNRERDADPSTHVLPDWTLELSPAPPVFDSLNSMS